MISGLLCMKLGDHNTRKVTDFSGNLTFGLNLREIESLVLAGNGLQ